jgi:carboxyl-terminal processing protease
MTEGFNFNTAAELTASINSLKSRGMRSLVLDLRGNPGGLLEQAVQVAGQFLPEGTVIVSQRGRRPFDNRVWRSKNPAPQTIPLIVLVDRDTASASEIVAGALQDHDRALIVGERTFGKGLVQNVIDLPSGGALTLTGARYFTPSGRCIQRDYSSMSSYDYFNTRTALVEPTSSSQTKTDRNRTVFGGNGIEPDDIVTARKLSKAELDLVERGFFFSRDYARAHAGSIETIRFLTSENELTAKADLFREFEVFLTASGTPALQVDPAIASSRLFYYLLLASGAEHPGQGLVSGDLVIKKALRLIPKAVEMANAPLPRPALDKRDAFAKRPVTRTKQPAGSHRRRAENRRN